MLWGMVILFYIVTHSVVYLLFIILHFSGLFKVGRWTAIDKSTGDEVVSSLKSKLPQYCLLSRANMPSKLFVSYQIYTNYLLYLLQIFMFLFI